MKPKTKYGLIVLAGFIGFSVIAGTLLLGSAEEKEFKYVRAYNASLMEVTDTWIELQDSDNNTWYYPVTLIGLSIDVTTLEKGDLVYITTKYDIENQAGKIIKIRVER